MQINGVLGDGEGYTVTTDKKPDELVEDIDFNGLSLHAFAEGQSPDADSSDTDESFQTDAPRDEYEKEKTKFEDLHQSIVGCDGVLKSVETYLTSFQDDLGAVSAEIETLQTRSTNLNAKLENRKKVEKLLGPAVEDISISPSIVKKISEGSIDESWGKALEVVEKRLKAVNASNTGSRKIRSVEDSKPLLENLKDRALERIRDFLVAQIKSLRSPNINIQIIQQQSILRYKDLYSFLAKHHKELGEEICQAYVNTAKWYYSHHFTRYRQALEKMKIFVADKNNAIGTEQSIQRGRDCSPYI